MASHSVARTDPLGQVRFAARIAALIAALLVFVPIHFLWRLFRLPSPWPRLFLALAARIIGARPRIAGAPLKRNVVFVANHTSWTDIPILGGATGSAFIATSDLRAAPLIGWLCTLNRTVFVSREDRLGVRKQIDQLRAAFAEGWAITIFPEGTTGDGVALLPFKASLLAALDPPPPGVVVQAVRIDYGAATPEVAWIDQEPGRQHATRLLSRPGGFEATLRFLEPFDPRDFPGRKAIAAEAKRRIADSW